jgi:hypothetical protein
MKIVFLFIVIIGFSQCGSLKLEENPPFKIISSVSKNWVGGQPGVKGINVKITYTTDKVIEFDSIYYSKKVAKLELNQSNNRKMIIGYFNTSTRKNDIILASNSKKEINNTVPEIKNFPFQLKEDEAINSYKIKGKIKYFKVTSIKKEQGAFFPSAPKQ